MLPAGRLARMPGSVALTAKTQISVCGNTAELSREVGEFIGSVLQRCKTAVALFDGGEPRMPDQLQNRAHLGGRTPGGAKQDQRVAIAGDAIVNLTMRGVGIATVDHDATGSVPISSVFEKGRHGRDAAEHRQDVFDREPVPFGIWRRAAVLEHRDGETRIVGGAGGAFHG